MRILLSDQTLSTAASVISRQIRKRIDRAPEVIRDAPLSDADVILRLSSDLSVEEFEISRKGEGADVLGGSPAAVIYGCGRLLRGARFAGQSVNFGHGIERSAPEKPIRGMYFATHFYNYYCKAPLDELQTYIEELALWGVNALMVWFDMYHFRGIADPEAQDHIARFQALHKFARSVGMKVGLCVVANETYADSPAELRADQRGFATFAYGNELCPSKPQAVDLLLRNFEEEFDLFAPVDYLWIWPYDSGGCGCEKCRPWGANGFLLMAERISQVFRQHSPAGKVILSTWLFDYPGSPGVGEWDGLYRRLEEGMDWVDIILADGHKEYPPAPLTRPLPKGIPLVNFPEISMLNQTPWGGYGANPLPAHWEQMWDIVGDHISGNFPYSEGIFEDVNKILWVQKNWNGSRSVDDILHEYFAWEFPSHSNSSLISQPAPAPHSNSQLLTSNSSPSAASQALRLMEETHYRMYSHDKEVIDAPNLTRAPEIWQIISDMDAQLPEWARSGWRWRLIFLRAAIDVELLSSGGRRTPRLLEYFSEIARISHVESRTYDSLTPPFMRVPPF